MFRVKTDKQFTGHQKEGDFIFMQSRFYDPSVGRFLQPDSIVPDPMNPQSLNRYSYVLNNPLRYTDPTGHSQENAWQSCFVLGCGSGVSSPPTEIAPPIGIGEYLLPEIHRCTETLGQDCPYSRASVAKIRDDFTWRTILLGELFEASVSDLNLLPWSLDQRLVLYHAGFGVDAGLTLAESDYDMSAPLLGVPPAIIGLIATRHYMVDPNAIELHHLLPEEFRQQWQRLGINHDEFIAPLTTGEHRLKEYGGVHTGANNYNAVWRAWLESNPSANRQAVMNQLALMVEQFRIGIP